MTFRLFPSRTENSPTVRLMEAIIEEMDEYYSDNLGEEVTRGMRESVSRGFYLSGKAPYGYRKIHIQDSGKPRTKLDRPVPISDCGVYIQ